MAHILIVTDAWFPQINGVVTTLRKTIEELTLMGHEVELLEPSQFKHGITVSPRENVRVPLFVKEAVFEAIFGSPPDRIHIATEGALGLAARNLCVEFRIPFTTAFHTAWPQYMNRRFKLPESLIWKFMRWFHSPALNVMVNTPLVEQILHNHGITNTATWTRGVDTDLFQYEPNTETAPESFGEPRLVYVGRVTPEKNLEAFLKLPVGHKTIIGNGPDRDRLMRKYPGVSFPGYMTHEEIAEELPNHDVFVFPSRTDTFGLVMLEANACGLPVAAYDVQGPRDVVRQGYSGVLHSDLETAVKGALKLNPADCRDHAETYSWRTATEQFVRNLRLDLGP